MVTNIDLDDDLLADAMRLTGERTKRGVVMRALAELVRIERLRAVRNARGSLKWDGDLAGMREERPTYGTTRRHKRSH